MVVVITSINVKRRLREGNHLNTKMELPTLEEFDTMTIKFIGKYAAPSLAASMLQNEDAIDYVRMAVMDGTCRYKPDCGMKLSSYQIYCAKCAIKRWIRECKMAVHTVSLNHDEIRTNRHEKAIPLYAILPDERTEDAAEQMLKADTLAVIQKCINCASLSGSQRECLRLHFFDGLTKSEVSRCLNISREAVGQSIRHGLRNIREQYGAELSA